MLNKEDVNRAAALPHGGLLGQGAAKLLADEAYSVKMHKAAEIDSIVDSV